MGAEGASPNESVTAGSPERVAELVAAAQDVVARQTDRLFVGLLAFQWAAAVALALWVAPYTWAGPEYRTHPHVWTAVVLGLVVISLPVWLGLTRPGQALTRHVVAVGQMLCAALLIHLTAGRLETHFHVFGSLAFLAFYRDWRVLVTATAVTAADHLVRGLVWPESVYGAAGASAWRWTEHAGWVVFLDVFLVYAIVRGNREVRATAERQAALEAARTGVEGVVRERTRELHESGARFKALTENATDFITVLDPTGRILYESPSVELLGYRPDALVGRTAWEFLHPDDLAETTARLRRAVAEPGSIVPVDVRFRDGNGQWRWLEGSGRFSPGLFGSGAVVVNTRDVTERRRAEAALRAAEDKYRSSFNDAAVGMALLDLDGRFLRVNRTLCAMVGYSEKELLARTFQDITHPDDAAGDADAVAGALGGERVYRREKRYLHRDGRVVWVQVIVSYACDEAGRPQHVVSQIIDISERKRTEEALKQSEERFRAVIEQASDAIFLTDDDGRVVDANRCACEGLGYTRDELVGMPIPTFDPDVTPEKMQWIGEQIRSSGHATFDTRHRRKDGSTFPVEIRAGRIDFGGRNLGLAVVRDITERKQAEEALRQSEERFRGAIEHAAIGMALVSPDGRFLRVNRALCGIVGYSPDELLARTFQGITHPDDLDADLAQVRRVLAGEIPTYQMEKRYFRKDGRVVWVLLSVSLVRDAAGAPLHFVSQIQDITERRRAEEERDRTRGMLMDAIESLDAGFVMYDADDRLVVCNSRHKEIYPVTAPLMTPGRPYAEILRAAYRGGVSTDLAEERWVAERLAAHRDPTGPVERKIGGRWVRISDRRTRDGGLVSLRTDITALKQAQEAAEAASRAKGEFLANMSHEIRTPMNGIMGLTDLLLETDLTREQRESLELVKSSADALLTVINDILDFSKIEAGKLDLDPHRFRLRDAVNDTLKTLALRAHAKGLELTCDVRPDVPDAVIGDAGRLRQILTNLVGNAVKFTESGEVGVRVERVPDRGTAVRLRFTVTDTGIGIPADKQRSIFDPFTQADGSTTRRYGGTGLGLTICARLVALMGGRIWVESAPGKGSRFAFEARFDPASGSGTRSGVLPAVDLRGTAVLVVDDNATNRRVLAETLQLWGARPVCTSCGPDALDELRRAAAAGEPYPLVLLDAMMPDVDGFSVAAEIAARPDLAGPVVMMLSSADRQEDPSRCRELGVRSYLLKPVKPAELHRAISLAMRCEGPESGVPSGTPAAVPPVRRLRILLAEDNPVNQRVAVRLLEGLGHSVAVGDDGAAAVSLSAGEAFDLILMDVQMPRLDGFEATRRIRLREAESGRRTPIVAMTAHAMKGDRERCLAAGMDDYLSKPVHRDDLAEVLGRVAGEAPASVDVTTPPPTARRAGPPAFDRAAALARLGGDEELFAELAELFRDEGPRVASEIREALAAGDAVGVRRSAHSLKGSAGYVGGTATASAAGRLETAGEARDLASAAAILSELEPELERLLAALATVAGRP